MLDPPELFGIRLVLLLLWAFRMDMPLTLEALLISDGICFCISRSYPDESLCFCGSILKS